jgi:hypothetical protein
MRGRPRVISTQCDVICNRKVPFGPVKGPALTQRSPWIRFAWVGRYEGSQKGPEELLHRRGLSAAPQEVRTSRRAP